MAKQPNFRRCIHCRQLGMVNAHGFLRGYSADGTPDFVRGRRFFCSNRGRKIGCGRTMSILFCVFIATFSVTTSLLFELVKLVLGTCSVRKAWLKIGSKQFSERSGYRLWNRLLASSTHIRTLLLRAGPPPLCETESSIHQNILHIKEHIQDKSTDPFAAFQCQFQVSLLVKPSNITV